MEAPQTHSSKPGKVRSSQCHVRRANHLPHLFPAPSIPISSIGQNGGGDQVIGEPGTEPYTLGRAHRGPSTHHRIGSGRLESGQRPPEKDANRPEHQPQRQKAQDHHQPGREHKTNAEIVPCGMDGDLSAALSTNSNAKTGWRVAAKGAKKLLAM
jgi:hypothetical protein